MTTTTLSIEEFYNLPDLEAGKRELLEGELIELPPTKAVHNAVADRLLDALKDYLKSQGESRGRARMEAGFEIATKRQSWLIPDVALLHPGQHINAAGYYENAPLIAFEVISSTNTTLNIKRKRLIYLGNGSEDFWIVDPDQKTITTEHSEGVSAMLPGFSLDLNEFFQMP